MCPLRIAALRRAVEIERPCITCFSVTLLMHNWQGWNISPPRLAESLCSRQLLFWKCLQSLLTVQQLYLTPRHITHSDLHIYEAVIPRLGRVASRENRDNGRDGKQGAVIGSQNIKHWTAVAIVYDILCLSTVFMP